MSFGKTLPTFRRIVVPSSLWLNSPEYEGINSPSKSWLNIYQSTPLMFQEGSNILYCTAVIKRTVGHLREPDGLFLCSQEPDDIFSRLQKPDGSLFLSQGVGVYCLMQKSSWAHFCVNTSLTCQYLVHRSPKVCCCVHRTPKAYYYRH